MNLNTMAAYATILSAGILIGGGVVGAVWRVWTWRREHGTNVKVQISMGWQLFGANAVDAVVVTVFNRSSHPVRVTGAGVEMNDGTGRAGHVPGMKLGADIPGIVAPHDQGTTWLETAELVHEGFDVYRKARAFARFGESDRPIWSKSRRLMRRSRRGNRAPK
jgi:hypothetical protein